MPIGNAAIVERALREFAETNEPTSVAAPDFVWDMSGFPGWTDEDEYRGRDGFASSSRRGRRPTTSGRSRSRRSRS